MRGDAGGSQRASRAWWAKTPLRLVVLLAVLIGVAAYGVPRIVDEASGSAPPSCLGPLAPTLRLTPAAIGKAVSASQMSSLLGDGVLDVQGVQDPEVAWSDTPPPSPAGGFGPSSHHAGYEIRWWSAGNAHRAVDLFLFRSAAGAAAFVRQAASGHCRRGAVAYELKEPVGGRALVWTNPVHVLQADVFFSRANRVYRLVEVASGLDGEGPSGVNVPRLIRIPQLMACWLKDATCATLGRGASD